MRASPSLVRVRRDDGVVTIVLDDPARRNALSWDMVRALRQAIDDAARSGCHALVLANAPPVFCAGGSVDDLLEPKAPLEEMYGAFEALDRAPMPTVAAVDGAAIGAGLNLVLACDVAVCTPESRFDARFLDVGLHPGGGQLWRLQRAVGPQAAAALTLFGEVLDGEGAAARGLVWRCVAPDQLAGEAARLARRATERDAEVVGAAKRSLKASSSVRTPREAIALELGPQRWSMARPAFEQSLRGLRARLGRDER
ncbi:MAG TPA: enoyl-CoA hydratase-related protein [Acidimicrobiales bacterium]|nr:enoyl-CoA hydratase-related protein [Acidimicrobiales bacterium]